jgi:predicted PurR-regulated permease PerM
VLISVLFGSTLFGVMGALLAIPVAAAIQITILEYENYRRPAPIGAVAARGEEPPPPVPPPPE